MEQVIGGCGTSDRWGLVNDQRWPMQFLCAVNVYKYRWLNIERMYVLSQDSKFPG